MQEYDIIETPEHVRLERRLAGLGSRFTAGLLDHVILFGIFLILATIFLIASPGLAPSGLTNLPVWTFAFLILIAFAIYWGFFVFFEMRNNGQSPGKRLIKIRVVKEGGSAISFTDIAIRNLLRPVDGLAGYIVAGITMFCSAKVQRLGDLAAGTVVTSEQFLDFSASTDRSRAIQWERETSPEALRATGLGPREYQLLSNYWMRRQEFTIHVRASLLPQLLHPILQRTSQTLPDWRLETLESYVDTLLYQAVQAEEEKDEALKAPEDAQ
ncbi:RDD family protein [Acidobacteriota bacterium]